MEISEAIHVGLCVAMITGYHKNDATDIENMLGTIGNNYSEATTGMEMEYMDKEQINNDVMHIYYYSNSTQNNICILMIFNIRYKYFKSQEMV